MRLLKVTLPYELSEGTGLQPEKNLNRIMELGPIRMAGAIAYLYRDSIKEERDFQNDSIQIQVNLDKLHPFFEEQFLALGEIGIKDYLHMASEYASDIPFDEKNLIAYFGDKVYCEYYLSLKNGGDRAFFNDLYFGDYVKVYYYIDLIFQTAGPIDAADFAYRFQAGILFQELLFQQELQIPTRKEYEQKTSHSIDFKTESIFHRNAGDFLHSIFKSPTALSINISGYQFWDFVWFELQAVSRRIICGNIALLNGATDVICFSFVLNSKTII